MLLAGQAKEHDHGGGVLAGDMQPAHGVGGAWAARDETDARLAGYLAPGLRHHRGTAFLSADHGLDAIGIVQPVKRCKKTFARHRECGAGALRLELIDQNLAAVTHARLVLLYLRSPELRRGRRPRVAKC